MSNKFNFFHGSEADQFSFYRIPKILFTDKRFAKLSVDAKVLYGLLLNRMSLSLKNGWIDEENRVYIYFKLEDAMEFMGIGKDKWVKLFAELDSEKGCGFIQKKRQGLGKPTIIFGNRLTMLSDDTTTTYFYDNNGNQITKAVIYEPETGRFMNEDPIHDGSNWYVYCGNNPILFIDSTGYIKDGDDKFNESIQIILNGPNKDGKGGLSLAWNFAKTSTERKEIAAMADSIRGFNANNINRHMIVINSSAAAGAGHTATLLLNESEQGLLFSFYSKNGTATGDGQMRIAFLNSSQWNGLLYNNKSVKLIASSCT